jgi:hypothetical protein
MFSINPTIIKVLRFSGWTLYWAFMITLFVVTVFFKILGYITLALFEGAEQNTRDAIKIFPWY